MVVWSRRITHYTDPPQARELFHFLYFFKKYTLGHIGSYRTCTKPEWPILVLVSRVDFLCNPLSKRWLRGRESLLLGTTVLQKIGP